MKFLTWVWERKEIMVRTETIDVFIHATHSR